MIPERLAAKLQAHGVDPTAPHGTGGTPEWTAFDAAMMYTAYRDQQGVLWRLDRRAELAHRYRCCRDDSVFFDLKACLFYEANELAHREKWPRLVLRAKKTEDGQFYKRYLEELAEMALVEDHSFEAFRKAKAWASWMGVGEVTWRKDLQPRYEAVRFKLDVWCGIAHGHAWRKLNDHSLEKSVA